MAIDGFLSKTDRCGAGPDGWGWSAIGCEAGCVVGATGYAKDWLASGGAASSSLERGRHWNESSIVPEALCAFGLDKQWRRPLGYREHCAWRSRWC